MALGSVAALIGLAQALATVAGFPAVFACGISGLNLVHRKPMKGKEHMIHLGVQVLGGQGCARGTEALVVVEVLDHSVARHSRHGLRELLEAFD